MLKKILIAIAAVLVLFVGFVAMRSSDIAITRSTTINAAPAAPYALVSNFSTWDKWSPWEQLDPDMKKTITGTPGAVGSTYHWVSDKDDVGEGKMTLTNAKPNELLDIDLHFIKPFEAKNVITFHFIPKGSSTEVSWSMTGRKDFMMKAVTLFMDMDAMVGADFEKGLAQLKAQSESAPMTATSAAGAATTSTGH